MWLVTGFSMWWPGFEPGSGHVGFVVKKMVLGQVFSEYFGFPCQPSVHQLLHNYHHVSSGADTIGQVLQQYQMGSVSPTNNNNNNNNNVFWMGVSCNCKELKLLLPLRHRSPRQIQHKMWKRRKPVVTWLILYMWTITKWYYYILLPRYEVE
jgi:hypothetical protein